ncbi:phage virion morphogenesis protein [Campylobacter gastrosuis]|uniref:Phage virion morphogenesis protein n=1 Tax=Campylobacter gastrosuis TaxID=2974576 RepID=A0ABT7HN11_9BACT|nr:phage virion morphogenesis protein [Campylobacter gastrosuis]MDL0088150.1 phage virion morphogenesis protein [Campylobacter gastrosuis]
MSVIIKELTSLEARLKNIESNTLKKSLFDDIGNMTSNTIKDAFVDESSPFGDKWQELSNKTKEYKKKKGKSSKILRDSGNLYSKWEVRSTANSVTVSNNSQNNDFAYGLSHQYGSNKRNIPARPFLPVDKSGNLEKKLKSNIKKLIISRTTKELNR